MTNKQNLPRFDLHQFKKRKTKYCICIPVLNEGEKFKKQINKILPYSKIADIVIADWGSTDKSTDKIFLKRNNVKALLVLKSPGWQGTQLRMAFSYAISQGYKGIIQMDGNNKDSVEDIPKFIKGLNEGYDYLQGSRFIKGGKAINTPIIRHLAIRLIASPFLSLAAKYWYTDVTNGFRGYSRKYLLHPGVKPFRDIFKRYEFNMYLTTRANQLHLRTKEVPVTRIYPKGTIPTKISFFKGSLNFLTIILKAALGFYNPK